MWKDLLPTEAQKEEAEFDCWVSKRLLEQKLMTTRGRYEHRKGLWKDSPLTHAWWWFIHNVPVHILIGLFPSKSTFKLHDWASRKLNRK